MKLVERILKILLDNGGIIPRYILEDMISKDYSKEDISSAIDESLDKWAFDLVLDYPEKKWNIHWGIPVWHLKTLTREKALVLQNLSKVDRALLRLLQHQNTPKHTGELKSDDIRCCLRDQGFSEEELSTLWIENLVENHYDFKDGKSIEWCRIISEDEKTEEYKRWQEESIQKSLEKEVRYMRMVEESEKDEVEYQDEIGQ